MAVGQDWGKYRQKEALRVGGPGSTGTCVVLICRMLLAQLASLLGG